MLNGLLALNNALARRRLARVTPAHALLLAPHCLQRSDCDRKILSDANACARCGRCDVAGLLDLRDRYGVELRMVAGGRQAVAAVRRSHIRGVIAVACGKELRAGILAAFPKPVLAVSNRCPHGPCRDTCVALDAVETALKGLASD